MHVIKLPNPGSLVPDWGLPEHISPSLNFGLFSFGEQVDI